MTERDSHRSGPRPLPPELVAALRDRAYVCLTIRTEPGTAFLLKAPALEIERVRGRVPIQLEHQLYSHPAAPVIRLVMRIYDDPLAPLAMESFINVADPDQRADYASFAELEEIPVLFLDEHFQQRLTKRITNQAGIVVPEVLAAAELLLAAIPGERVNFERAKQAVQEAAEL